METRNLIHIYKDGNEWCAIYPMGSDIMSCEALAYAPVNVNFNEQIGRSRDYGKYQVLQKLKDENPNLPTHSFYCDYWD
jgi:hypothetical protein